MPLEIPPIVNELPNVEIDSKIGLSNESNITEVSSELMQLFADVQIDYSLLTKNGARERMTTFKRYRDKNGVFSIRERGNGTFCFKRKSKKQKMVSGVSVNHAEKIDFSTHFPDHITNYAAFIIAFTRKKLNFHLQNLQNRRVFSIKVDQYEVINDNKILPLKQVEIEYKGLIGVPDVACPGLVHQLARDTHHAAETVFASLQKLGFKPERNPKTLGKWLRGQ